MVPSWPRPAPRACSLPRSRVSSAAWLSRRATGRAVPPGVALVSILDRIGALEDEARQRLARYLDLPITNWSGRKVGRIRAIVP